MVAFRQWISGSLGQIPFLITESDIVGVASHNATCHAPGGSEQQPGGREQCHLGVDGYFRKPIGQRVFRNSAFAEIANEVGGENLQKTAEAFGYNQRISLGKLGVYTSEIKTKGDDQLELGWAGIGQSTTLVTPLLQMRIMGAIANGGVPTEPYIVQKVTTAAGFVSETASVKTGSRAVSEETAAELKSLLRNNFKEQYGDWYFSEGLNPCGKSGTAETEPNKTPHAWFTGFLDNAEHPYAFAVIVEEGGSGSQVALPVAAEVINALVNS